METYKIELPERISAECAQKYFSESSVFFRDSLLPNYSKVVFDFSKCKTISPVGLIYIQMWHDTLCDLGKETFFRKGDPKTHSFLQKMKLLPSPNGVEAEVEEEFYFYSIHRCKNTQECSNAHRDIISKVLVKDSVPNETYCAIDYMLNEIWDNAGVHGYECYSEKEYPKPVYICAQEFDSYYEVCIGDRGQGIYQSLQKNNKEVRGKNKKESIKAAIQDGISGHPNGSPGFGLYSTAEFIRGGNGILYIWSSGCFLKVSSKTDKIYNGAIENGTLVSFIIEKGALIPFEKTMSTHTRYSENVASYIEEVIGGMFDEQ